MRSFAANRSLGVAGLAVAILTLLASHSRIAAAEPIAAGLIDGRVIVGDIDDQTDAERLWLRREVDGVQLCSGFAWRQVQTVRRGQSELSGRDVLHAVESLKTPAKTFLQIVPAANPDVAARPRTVSERRVQSLHIEAQLARWGQGAATDGLRVFVYPLSADGEIVPVRGQLDLALMAELTNARGGEYSLLSPEFHELETSSELVRIDDFARGPAVYQLPFRRFHPDVDFDIAQCAIVHARLGIAGQGVFEASAACVPMREFSPIRDQLQLYRQQRFFPGENVQLTPR